MNKALSKIIWQSKDGLSLQSFTGEKAKKYLKQIANIRITMFKEFPYLYKGSLEYEEEYLNVYFNSKNSIILLVLDGDKVVGFSNSIPLKEEMEEVKAPFIKNKIDISKYLYVGEMMIKEKYRNKGLSNIIAKYHEQCAKDRNYTNITFMTVIRPNDHPLKPENYRPLEPLWKALGCNPLKEIKIKFSWKQVDKDIPQENQLAVWSKKLG
ncbi:MAG: GNAT family N-acetyltransferase [Rickettsiales bacterium]|jgi:hypothetical protein|nr:GNAT family N-acetyltransferase [Rickettsiales bacterium]